jgi:hypothetical protein
MSEMYTAVKVPVFNIIMAQSVKLFVFFGEIIMELRADYFCF